MCSWETLYIRATALVIWEKRSIGDLYQNCTQLFPTGLAVFYPQETSQHQSSVSGSDCVPLKPTKEGPWNLQCVGIARGQKVLEYIPSAITWTAGSLLYSVRSWVTSGSPEGSHYTWWVCFLQEGLYLASSGWVWITTPSGCYTRTYCFIE